VLRVALVGLALATLAGCSPTSDPAPSPTAPTAPGLAGTPLEVPCSALVDPDAVLPLWPGLAVADAGAGAADDLPADVVRVADLDGTVCRYVADGGVEMTVAVAEPDAESLDRIANGLVTTSTAVPTYGVEGYFERTGGSGTAEAVGPPWWVVASSEAFVEPGDAEPVVAAALAALAAERP